MKPSALFSSVIVVLFSLMACHEKESAKDEKQKATISEILYSSESANSRYDEKNMQANRVPAPAPPDGMLESKMGQQSIVLQNLMLSLSGDIHFETKDILKTMQVLENAIFKLNGYVSLNQLENGYQKTEKEILVGDSVLIRKHYKRSSTLKIHIPIAHFDSLMQCINQEAIFVDQRNLTATAQRIQFLRSQKSETQLIRWLSILKETNLKSPNLASNEKSPAELIRDEISNADDAAITIEEIKQKIDFAQLSLRIYEAPYIRETKQLRSTVEQQDGFFSKAWQSITKGWEGISAFLIQLLIIWPILILLGISIYAFKKWRKNKNRPTE